MLSTGAQSIDPSSSPYLQVGDLEGLLDGALDGAPDGVLVGPLDGAPVVGADEGDLVGGWVGGVGDAVGWRVIGDCVGEKVGEAVLQMIHVVLHFSSKNFWKSERRNLTMLLAKPDDKGEDRNNPRAHRSEGSALITGSPICCYDVCTVRF
jgi:hypothetical protein